MKTAIIIKSVAVTVLLFFVMPPMNTSAIPAFSRKYQISCQVCHSPAMPRLKGFGEEFAGNGFRLTEYESPRHFVQTGDDKLSLFRELPLGIRMDGFASHNFNNEGSADFAAPFVLKILSPKGDMSKWYLTGLFNWLESDIDELDYSSATLHAGYLLRRNVRIVSEFTYIFSGTSYGKLSAGFISAF